MSSEDNRKLVRRFIEKVNERDYEALDDLLAPDFVRHCQATPDVDVRSSQDFKQFDRTSRESFPDQRIVIDRLIAEGDFVACWCRYLGTQRGPMGPLPASGKQVDVDFGGCFRVANGRLAEAWVTWDNVTLLKQLGHLPAPQPS
jgi:steroid delta-isomerase-like uncharacterized protein